MKYKKTVLVHLDSARGYSRDILRGIYAYNNEYSHWHIVYEPAYFLRKKGDDGRLSIIDHVRPDGCILELANSGTLLLPEGVPVVQVASVNAHPEYPVVLGNYEQEACLAASYFKRKGFGNMAFFGIKDLSWSEDRLKHFQRYCEEFTALFFSYLLDGNHNDVLSNNFQDLLAWLTKLPKPIAIWCCNDDFGQILINSCITAGINVPHQVSVLGIDNDDLICNITHPNLSSIARNPKKIAFDICRQLDKLMEGAVPSREVIAAEPMEVCERASTDSLGYTDELVSKAIQFISSHLSKPITVADVAAHCKVSFKILNTRFRTFTGATVYQEIQFRKLNRFKTLLQSSMSIKQIAFELGFEDSSHISRWFSNLEGMPPNEWKKRYL